MESKRFWSVTRAGLMVLALLVSGTALAGTQGYYNWSAKTTTFVGEFTNTGTGGGVKANTAGSSSISFYGYAVGSTAQATRGYNTDGGYGVYGRSVSGTGVYGENNSSSGGYGGYFTGFNGLKAYTSKANGYAGWFTATGGTGFGVRAQSSASTGYGVYSTGGSVGVYGEGVDGVLGRSSVSYGDAVQADATGYSVWGVNAYTDGSYGHAVVGETSGTYAKGGSFTSAMYNGVYAEGGAGYYDLVAPNSALIGGTVFPPKGGLALMARNDGDGTLQEGDLAVFLDFDAAALSGGVALAAKAGSGPGVVLGVVQGAYILDDASAAALPDAPPEPAMPVLQADVLVPPAPVPEGEELRVEEAAGVPESPQAPAPARAAKRSLVEPGSGRFVEGSVEPGQYMVLSYLGLVRVNVTARTAIRAGDWIVVTGEGAVIGVPSNSYSWALDRGYTIVGRAMEPLASGSGQIYVQVNLR